MVASPHHNFDFESRYSEIGIDDATARISRDHAPRPARHASTATGALLFRDLIRFEAWRVAVAFIFRLSLCISIIVLLSVMTLSRSGADFFFWFLSVVVW